MLRFVVLTHDYPDWHWDFMLESEGALRTWRLDQDPSLTIPIQATPLSDHRLSYLDYEGPVSGQRGEVRRWDQGQYEMLSEADGDLAVVVHGTRLWGRARLTVAENNSTWFRFSPEIPDQG